ncbi:MAG TPA: hypothetical protein VG984_02080 [Candidatus Paceibacterota bacterium]|nr:hypothetical protein [Candidatus Paceibacterota bacterium]
MLLPIIILSLVAVAAACAVYAWPSAKNSPAMPTSQSAGIQKKTPAELQEIAMRYGLKITGKAGNTWDRLLIWAVIGLIVLVPDAYIMNLLVVFPPKIRIGMALGLFIAEFSCITWYLSVPVPKVTAAMAMDIFTGRVHVFTQGWFNIRLPWEVVNPDTDYISLRSSTFGRSISFPTMDGLTATFPEPTVRWRTFGPLLLVHISHSTETINEGALDIFESDAREQVAKVTMDELSAKIPDIQVSLIEALAGTEQVAPAGQSGLAASQPKDRDVRGSSFEEQYGATVERVVLGTLKLPTDYAEAREGEITMEIYRRTARKNVEASMVDGKPTTTFQDEMDKVMLNAKEKGINRDVRIIRVETNSEATETAKHIGGGFGAFAAGLAAAFGGGKKNDSNGNHGHDNHGGDH